MSEQDIFAVRTQVDHWPLDLIAYNLDASSVVLHWPSRRQLISEIQRSQPKYVAIPVVSATFERAENMTKEIKDLFPNVQIVYGGFPPEKGAADEIMIGEGVSKFRELIGEEQNGIRHPLIFADYSLLNLPLSSDVGIVLEKIGCDNRCDFCSTSHYHNGAEYLMDEAQENSLLDRYVAAGSRHINMLNEDHLNNTERNAVVHKHIRSLDQLLDIMCFSCMDSVQQYNPEDLFDLGYRNIWVGVEDFSSKYTKNDYSKLKEFIETMHQHRIRIMTSCIIGSPEHTLEDSRATIDTLINLGAYANQVTIKVPFAHTPFSKQIQITDPRLKNFDAHHLVFNHPTASKQEIEGLQIEAQKRDYYELGPSFVRAAEIMFKGYKTFKNSNSPRIKRRAQETAVNLRTAASLFDLVIRRHPNPVIKEKIKELKEEITAEVGKHPLYLPSRLLVESLGFYESVRLELERRYHSLMRQPKFKRNVYNGRQLDRKSTRLNSSHTDISRMPSSA